MSRLDASKSLLADASTSRTKLFGRTFLLVALMAGTPIAVAADNFGELPHGALSSSKLSDIRAEICRDHLFDPKAIRPNLPAGFRLVSAATYSRNDAGIAALIARDARYADYGVGSLCFVSGGSFLVDEIRVNPDELTSMAFWWAQVEGPRDPRMRGTVNWVQLASFYAAEVSHRAQITATDPMAQFVEVRIAKVDTDLWQARLVLENEVVEAEVRVSGQPRSRNGPQPGFMSVPFSGGSAEYFTVFSFFGHQHRPATGKWQAKGRGVFTESLQIPGEANVLGTHFQSDWQALSGLYRFER